MSPSRAHLTPGNSEARRGQAPGPGSHSGSNFVTAATLSLTRGCPSGPAGPLTFRGVPDTEVPHAGLRRQAGSGEDQGHGGVPWRPRPAEGPASRGGPAPPAPAPPPGPAPPLPARASRSPGPRAPAPPAPPQPRALRGAGRPSGGMRGRSGGRALWPAPVRSLLRAFGARDAAASARGPSQGKRRLGEGSPAGSPALGRCAVAGMPAGPPAQRWAPTGSRGPRSQGGRRWSHTRAVRAVVRGAGLGVGVRAPTPSCSLSGPCA